MSSPPPSAYIPYRFGGKLRALRLSQGLTLHQMALALGLSAHGYLSELERSKKMPTVELVLRAARFFNVTTDQLLKDESDLPSGMQVEGP